MAGNCNPPYKCGTGGWCGCSCGCCLLCPCYTEVIYHVEISNIPGAPTQFCNIIDPFTTDITITFDGCFLYSAQLYDIGFGYFTTFGSGTVTIDPVAIDDFSCSKSGACTVTTCLYLPEESYFFTEPESFSFSVEDCTEFSFNIGCSSFCEPCCYISGVDTTDSTLIGQCQGATPMLSRKKIMKQRIKNTILSRIKKVHYKP